MRVTASSLLFLLSILVGTSGPNALANASTNTPPLRAKAFAAMSKERKAKLIQAHVTSSGRFYKARYRHYYVYHAVNAEQALYTALLADTFYHQFKSLFKKPFKFRRAPTIYVLANRGDYADTIRAKTSPPVDAGVSGGMYIQQKGLDAIFLYPNHRNQINMRLVKHEAAHQLLQFYTNTYIPNWFTEGIAVNMETWEHTRQPDQDIALSPFLSAKASVIPHLYPKSGYYTAKAFQKQGYALWQPNQRLNPQYASAWAIIHTLLSNDEGRTMFNTIIDELRRKRKTDLIFNEKRLASIDAMVDKHLNKQVIPTVTHIRQIHALINKPDYAATRVRLNDMRETYGETLEYTFYDTWLKGCLAEPASEAGKNAITQLLTYENLDRRLPRVHQAIAELALRHGDKNLARQHAVQMGVLDTGYERAKTVLNQVLTPTR